MTFLKKIFNCSLTRGKILNLRGEDFWRRIFNEATGNKSGAGKGGFKKLFVTRMEAVEGAGNNDMFEGK